MKVKQTGQYGGKKYWSIKKCRICGSSNLELVFDMGNIYISDFIKESTKRGKAPLKLVFCKNCKLLQLQHTFDRELLYRKYWYRSGINESMRKALQDIVNSILEYNILKRGDVVLDIGCNDGTMLRMYPRDYLITVGFEPAYNLIDLARERTSIIFNDFFSSKSYFNRIKKKAKVITCIAMFYDLDDPNQFLKDIKEVLDKDGLLVIEQRYMPSMIEQHDIGNICHEHLAYYSLTTMKYLLSKHNLEIIDVSFNKVNGGSFRLYIMHRESSILKQFQYNDKIEEIIKKESKYSQIETYKQFFRKVEKEKRRLCKFIKDLKKKGKVIHVYGASTKGNTMLQYWNLDSSIIEAAAERDPRKYGLKMIGSNIPIISEEISRKRADYFLILPWHFLDVFLVREKEYLKKGGKFIIPLPHFKVINYKEISNE